MSHISPFEMVLASNIPERLVQDIAGAKKYVHLQSMNFETSHQMSTIIDAALSAAERGVEVTLAFDRISFTEPHGTALRSAIVLLQAAGIAVKLLGRPLIPLKVAGRSHTKVYLIDDISYFGGGVNLTETSFGCHDFMLRTVNDVPLLKILHELIDRQPIDPSDWRGRLDDGQVLVDGGRRNHSLILDKAAQLAKQATRAWYVSQFAPGHSLEKELGTLPSENLSIWFNTPSSSRVRDKPAALVDNHVSKLVNLYKGTRRIHAKFIVIQKADSSYLAITGSHNFSDWGVRFGTKEAALLTTDQALCRQLIKFAEMLDT